MSRTFAQLIAEAEPRELIATQTELLGSGGVSYGLAADNADALAVSTTVDNQEVIAKLSAFNGTAFDRLRSEGNDRDAIAVGTLGNLQTLGFLHGWNGTTWDRIKTMAASGSGLGVLRTGAGNAQTAGDGGSNNEVTMVSTSNTSIPLAVYPKLFNEVTWDRPRNNVEESVLPVSARTAQTVSSTQTNYNGRGLLLIVNVTADPATASITPSLRYKIPTGGGFVTFWTAAAPITATGVYSYIFAPGLDATAGSFASYTEARNILIPRDWLFRMNVADTDSMTYGVDAVTTL